MEGWRKHRTVVIGSAGFLFGYGYCLPPYGTAYCSALRTTRTRTTIRTLQLSVLGLLGSIFCTASSAWLRIEGLVFSIWG
jgi:hypothetical protein